jgi:hypothetical protein
MDFAICPVYTTCPWLTIEPGRYYPLPNIFYWGGDRRRNREDYLLMLIDSTRESSKVRFGVKLSAL